MRARASAIVIGLAISLSAVSHAAETCSEISAVLDPRPTPVLAVLGSPVTIEVEDLFAPGGGCGTVEYRYSLPSQGFFRDWTTDSFIDDLTPCPTAVYTVEARCQGDPCVVENRLEVIVHAPFGAATLVRDGAGDIVVSNLVGGGDGVSILVTDTAECPGGGGAKAAGGGESEAAGGPRTGTEEWIELGSSAVDVSGTSSGDTLQTDAYTRAKVAGGSQDGVMRVAIQHSSGGDLEFTADFSGAASTTFVLYEVLDDQGGSVAVSPADQNPTGASVAGATWPVKQLYGSPHAFSLKWDTQRSFTVPGLPGVQDGYELRIFAENPTFKPKEITRVDIRDTNAIPSRALTSFKITAGEFPLYDIPALSQWGLLVLVVILLGSGVYLIRRRRPARLWSQAAG